MRSNAFGVTLLFIAGFVLVQNLPGWWDLEFGDETMYLGSGLNFGIPFPGGAQWGPVYAAWYAFWHLFIPDRLDLYYFNWAILSVLSGVLTFCFFRSLKVAFWVSVWLAVLFLFSTQNLPLNPKISIFPFCLILACLSLNQFFSTRLSLFQKFLLVSLTGLLCAYVRPEFYISFLLSAVVALYFSFKGNTLKKTNTWIIAIAFIFIVVGLHLLFDNPLTSGGGDRSAVAFQQHFVLNYCSLQNIPEPNTIDGQIQLFHQVLGNDVQSITDALIKQPVWALKHVGYNVVNSVKGNALNLVDMFYHTPFRGWYSRMRIILFAGVFLAILLAVDYKKTVAGFRKISQEEIWSLVTVLILIFPSLIATILVYPRTHYMVFHLLLIFWVIAYVYNRLAFRMPELSAVNIPAIIFTINTIVFTFFITVRYFDFNHSQPTPTADNVRFITGMKPQTHLNILERHWYRVFLPFPTTWVHVEEYTNGNFEEFVKTKNVNFILMTDDMQQFFAKDLSFQSFRDHYASYGFERVQTNGQGGYLLFKKGVVR